VTAGAACVLRPPGLRRDPWRSTRQGERRGPGGRGARAAPAGATVAETGWRGRCVHRLSACGQRGAQRGGCAAGAPLAWRAPAASPPASTEGTTMQAAEGRTEGAAAARLCVRAAPPASTAGAGEPALAGGVSAACRAGPRTVGGSHGPPRQRALARGEGATRHRGSAACRAGCQGGDDSRASPVHHTCPVEGDFSPGLALCQRSLAHRVDGWRINPMQSGQDPMHQCAGGPGLHARSIERPGRAALILAYSTHPTCPVEGRSSPGPGLPGRTRRIVMTGGGQNPMHQCHPRARSL